MFSKASFISISLAMVTPSLVMRGLPNFLPSTTLRPLGPRVILTVSASWSMPAQRALRASSPCIICLAISVSPYLFCCTVKESLVSVTRSFHNGQDVALADDGAFLAIDLDLGAGILAGQDLVAHLDDHLHVLAIHIAAGADSQDFRDLRLF